ncbi:dATP/dGTP diphosphohydrolase domain-containing protein [Mesorhizobium sp. B2-1-2]|uniref:dATP/dGTP diphosphohydrolase domain-containing protein n=1 Tax=Mesorhizobium sp. B2-1-2 TaxID=2589973 RepID=UPI001746EF03|nr:dATP/dGTP diphosphohydrolase domain-containing protein [Mesorhizobium sp. B2-1-2]
MNTVIVYGPQGCGKTTNAEALLKHFGCEGIEDGWSLNEHIQAGALHLTDERADDLEIAHKHGLPGHIISFADAMREIEAEKPADSSKLSNPKDGVGVKKWRQFCTVPQTVVAEVGVAMLEGHLKGYRRHNFRVAGVRSSVYADAAIGHIIQWWEGEDFDPDVPGGKMSHITKAIASLVVLRDAMIQNMLNDDRPPKGNLATVRADMQATVDALFERYPKGAQPFTEIGVRNAQMSNAIIADAKITDLKITDVNIGTVTVTGRGDWQQS